MRNAGTIVVVGGGIIGISSAWALIRHGFEVIVIDERPNFLQGISSAGFGSLTPFSDPFYRGTARDFAAHAVHLYLNGWLQDICAASDTSVAFSNDGLLQLCISPSDLVKADAQCADLIAAGYRAAILSPKETHDLEPALTTGIVASLWMDEPWIDKKQYFAAMISALSRRSSFHEIRGDRVVAIDNSPSGVIVTTYNRRRIEGDGAIICNGLSPDAISGIPSLPLQWIRGDALSIHTTDDRPLLKRHVYYHDGFITPRTDSELLLGTTYEPETLPSLNARNHCERIAVDDMLRIVAANKLIIPNIGELEIDHVWRNWRPTLPDRTPALGPFPHNERVIVANGFIGLGITLSPAVGESIANYFSRNDSTSPFPKSFHPARLLAS